MFRAPGHCSYCCFSVEFNVITSCNLMWIGFETYSKKKKKYWLLFKLHCVPTWTLFVAPLMWIFPLKTLIAWCHPIHPHPILCHPIQRSQTHERECVLELSERRVCVHVSVAGKCSVRAVVKFQGPPLPHPQPHHPHPPPLTRLAWWAQRVCDATVCLRNCADTPASMKCTLWHQDRITATW